MAKDRSLLISWALIIFIFVATYALLLWQSNNILTDQTITKKGLIARAGAKTIEVFVQNLGFQTSLYTGRSEIVSPDRTNTPKALQALVEGWKDTPVSGALLTDAKGIVLYGYTRGDGPTGSGTDLSAREYFKWAGSAKEGEIYIGTPVIAVVGAASGHPIVPIASPIFSDDKFQGVLVVGFRLDDLTEKYLDPLKSSDSTRAYMIDQSGVILSSPTQKLVGVNYLEYIRNSKIIGSQRIAKILASALESGSEGSIVTVLPDETKNGALTRFLIGYAPVRVGGAYWLLAVATPATATLSNLTPFYFSDMGIAIFVVVFSIGVSVYLAGGRKWPLKK